MKNCYRPEIDGLRAIAVIAVVLYHSKINLLGQQIFKGGFIGVDIFLVISGYLITSIIIKELITTGTFSFKHFYERRIRRILPVLLFIMLVSLPFAWIYLMPDHFVDFSKSILYSLSFTSNFYFWYTGELYGATSGLLLPFLHTWSLSIEEQYYILFPIVLFVIFRYFRKYLIHIFILILILSLGIADWGSKNYTSATFYLLHSRIWELLAGSILAYFEITIGHRSKYHRLNLVLPTFGLFLISYSILFFNDKMFHPSFYTLVPIIGVCLIIWFSHKDELITKILSSKLFVGIGLISYSIYLWHYPIYAFSRITEFTQGSIVKKLLIIITIILLSIISYYFIEQPFRNKKNKFKIIFLSIIMSYSVLIIFNLNIILKDGAKQRMPEIIQEISSEICGKEGRRCNLNLSFDKKVFAVGDSVMRVISAGFRDKVVNKDYQFIDSTLSTCLYFPGFDFIDIKTTKATPCNNTYLSKLREILSKQDNSIIIFSGNFAKQLNNSPFDNQEGGFIGHQERMYKYIPVGDYQTIQSSFKNEVLKLSKKNNIILIYPVPEVGWHVPSRLNNIIRKESKNGGLDREKFIEKSKYITTSYQIYKNRTKSTFELFDSIRSDNIYRVYPSELLCDTLIKNRCITHDDKNVFYSDHFHPSLVGAKMIGELIMKQIKKIEFKPTF